AHPARVPTAPGPIPDDDPETGDEMKEIQATATEHMRRDLETGPKWTCDCEACVQLRSLVGVEKVLGVRPLVREIEHLGTQLAALLPGTGAATRIAGVSRPSRPACGVGGRVTHPLSRRTS